MLHFTYGQKALGILINYSLERGIFVLQITNILPMIDLSAIYSGRDLIKMSLGERISNQLKDIEIKNIGKWNIVAFLADKMYRDNIFLAGDSAHSYPPSGGFGMNSGIQDIN